MQIFESRDFYLSAFLIANGYELADHSRNHGYTTFFFRADEGLNKIVKEFYSLKTEIEPIKYSQALRALKGIIHSLSASTSNRGINNNESNNNRKDKSSAR